MYTHVGEASCPTHTFYIRKKSAYETRLNQVIHKKADVNNRTGQ